MEGDLSMFWTGFGIGSVVGAIIGVIVIAVFSVNGKDKP